MCFLPDFLFRRIRRVYPQPPTATINNVISFLLIGSRSLFRFHFPGFTSFQFPALPELLSLSARGELFLPRSLQNDRQIIDDPDKQPHHGQIIYIKRYRRLTVIQENKLCPQKHVSRQISCHKSIQTYIPQSVQPESVRPGREPLNAPVTPSICLTLAIIIPQWRPRCSAVSTNPQ